MIGLGTLANVVGILLGAAIGAIWGDRLNLKIRTLTTELLGLITLVNGALSLKVLLGGALVKTVGGTWILFLVLGALLSGAFLGSALQIEERMESLGNKLKNRFVGDADSRFGEGFVTASLVFCIGPLAVMGAFDDAMGLGIDKLLLKATLDAFLSIAFAASLGWGVAMSALAVGVYQGALTLIGFLLGSLWDPAQVEALTAVGGILLIAVGLKVLHLKPIAVGNAMPALFIAPYLVSLFREFA